MAHYLRLRARLPLANWCYVFLVILLSSPLAYCQKSRSVSGASKSGSSRSLPAPEAPPPKIVVVAAAAATTTTTTTTTTTPPPPPIYFGTPLDPSSIVIRPINQRKPSSEGVKIADHANLNTEQIIRRYKYPAESHRIITEDGFVLRVYRIPRGKYHTQNERRPVVYLQDGIHFSSSIWFMASEVSLPFLLADQGYDVWIGNSRESKTSQHLKYSSNDTEYWNYGIDEIGKYDRPAIIDYILRVTRVHRLNYIGFSLGTTELFILLSTKPEYNSRISRVVAITPLAYLKYTRCHISHLKDDPKEPKISVSPSNDTTTPVTRSRIADHLNQWIKSDTFSAFDYGEEGNKLRYKANTVENGTTTSVGLSKPPNYNLSAITVPVFGFYASGDDIVVAEDALKTLNELGNWANRETSQVQHSDWGHFDFLIADGIKTYVIDPVITFMEMDL